MASALLAPDASAQTVNAGAGIFVGIALGERTGIHYGAELFGHRVSPEVTYNCGRVVNPRARTAIGPLVQISSVGIAPPRLSLAVHAAREIAFDRTSWGAELGLSYRFVDRPGFGIHTGLSSTAEFVNGAMRAQWLLDEYSLTMGVRGPSVFAPLGVSSSCAIPGRPLRGERGPVAVAERCRVLAEVDEPLPGAPRELAAAWERDAQYECASIPAFLDLARTLLACGAPPELVERALESAGDEIRHALLCSELARRLGGVAVLPSVPATPPRAAATGLEGLIRLATESWLDGCLGEGQAALVAQAGAEHARDAAARRVQSLIARDEGRHAALAWDVLAWALAEGGEPVRAALRAGRDVCLEPPSPAVAPDGLSAWGRIDAARMAALFEGHLTRSQRRLTTLLAA